MLTLELDQCVVVEHLRTRRDCAPFEVLAVWGANGNGRLWQRLMVHSQHGLLGLYEGIASGLVLQLDYVGRLPDPEARLLYVIRRMGPDRFTFESQRRTRSDLTWRVPWRADYPRSRAR